MYRQKLLDKKSTGDALRLQIDVAKIKLAMSNGFQRLILSPESNQNYVTTLIWTLQQDKELEGLEFYTDKDDFLYTMHMEIDLSYDE